MIGKELERHGRLVQKKVEPSEVARTGQPQVNYGCWQWLPWTARHCWLSSRDAITGAISDVRVGCGHRENQRWLGNS
jgi:hypothetical protein